MKIGVAGITTSGKSTLADALKKKFEAVHITSDDFYFQENFRKTILRGKEVNDWDTPDGINWNEFESYCEKIKGDLVFIDSFLLFYSEKIENMLDAVIVIEYDESEFEIALQRRTSRLYNVNFPKDFDENPEKSEIHFECAYFKDIAWNGALRHPEYRYTKRNIPILKLRATASIEENIARAEEFIKKHITQTH